MFYSIKYRGPDPYTIVAGSTKLNRGGDVYNADLVIQHKDWDFFRNRNDIGLVRVSNDIVFKKNVQPIALPTSDFSKSNYAAILSGWGTKKVRVPTFSS